MNRGRTRNQFEGFSLLVNVFFGVDDDFGLDAGVRKKLLRFGTRLSALAVIVPINFLSHCSFLLIYGEAGGRLKPAIKTTSFTAVNSSTKSSDLGPLFLSLQRQSGMILGSVVDP
jgi:hypothetical protein